MGPLFAEEGKFVRSFAMTVGRARVRILVRQMPLFYSWQVCPFLHFFNWTSLLKTVDLFQKWSAVPHSAVKYSGVWLRSPSNCLTLSDVSPPLYSMNQCHHNKQPPTNKSLTPLLVVHSAPPYLSMYGIIYGDRTTTWLLKDNYKDAWGKEETWKELRRQLQSFKTEALPRIGTDTKLNWIGSPFSLSAILYLLLWGTHALITET
jgi:hypothetical protein